jgi:HD-GYP domain-containing protein (c-di-GMP phosphodiesterase class II)
VAAHLHDLGRLAVTNAIWEKPGPLTSAEWEQVRMHAYHSERILATSGTLEHLAPLAGMHHERLDGSGYHRGCSGREQPVAVRVLAAADAFQAMTQDRPHRARLSAEQAADEVVSDARAGRLDGECVAAVLEAAGQTRPRAHDLRPAGLSEREIEVLRLVAAGLSNLKSRSSSSSRAGPPSITSSTSTASSASGAGQHSHSSPWSTGFSPLREK